jgi:hypothetical protein
MLLSRQAIITLVTIGAVAAVLVVWGVLSSRAVHRQAAIVASATAPQPVLRPTIDLIGTASIALQACTLPSPPAAPDGATASLNQMLAARNEFQAYDAATNAYLSCVDATVERVAKQSASVAAKADLDSLHMFGVRAHNTAIDQEQAYVDQFNVQVRSYKAKHPSF